MARYSEAFQRKQQPSFQFGYRNEYFYSTQSLETRAARASREEWSAMKKEYTRMRDVAQKRLKRLQKSEFSKSTVVTDRPEGFPKLKDIDPRDLPKAMHDLYKFLNAKTSTLYGQRQRMEKTINTFAKHGIELSAENYSTFIRVLEAMRKNKITYESSYAKELTEMILSSDKLTMRSITAKSRMKKLMEIAHDADRKKKFLDELNRRQEQTGAGKYTAVSYDKTIKSFGW